jgi:hypothetical protein
MDIKKFALNSFRSEGFLTISKILIEKFGIIKATILSNYLDKYVYWQSKRGADFDGWFYLRYKDQTHQLGGDFKETALRNYRDYFIEQGILLIKNEGLPKKTYYSIDFECLMKYVYGEDLYLGMQGSYQTHSKAHYIYKKNINKEKNYNKKFSRGNGYISPNMFEKFWEVYPKKTDKGKALSKWKQLCNKKERPKLKTLITAINVQKETKRWQNGFIPMPTTWLNQSRWLDDIEPMNEEFNKPKQKQSTPSTKNYWGQENNYGKKKTVLGKYGKVIKKKE